MVRRTPLLLTLLVPLASPMLSAAQAKPPVQATGLTARIAFERVLAGFLTELNGRYKLRITELTIAPGGAIGPHHHAGPGIRLVTTGHLTYVLPDTTIVYRPGDYYFEAGDVTHRAENHTREPVVHLLFEVLPSALQGPSLLPPPQPSAPRTPG